MKPVQATSYKNTAQCYLVFPSLVENSFSLSNVSRTLSHLQSNGILSVRRPKVSSFAEEMELAPHTVSEHWN